MWPGFRISPSAGWTAGSRPARSRILGSALGPVRGMCSTTSTAASRSGGRPATSARSASTPPADAPTPTSTATPPDTRYHAEYPPARGFAAYPERGGYGPGPAVIDEAEDGVSVESTVLPDPASGVIVVALRGDLTLESVPTVRAVLLKCFAEFPEAVIADVGELRAETASPLTVFPATARVHAAPVTSLLLCGVSPGLARLIDDRQFEGIPFYDTREAALSAVRAA